MTSKYVFGFTPEFLEDYDNTSAARLKAFQAMASQFEPNCKVFLKVVGETLSYIRCHALPKSKNKEEGEAIQEEPTRDECKTTLCYIKSSFLQTLKEQNLDWIIIQHFNDEERLLLFSHICLSGRLELLKFISGLVLGGISTFFTSFKDQEQSRQFFSELEAANKWHIYLFILEQMSLSWSSWVTLDKESAISSMRRAFENRYKKDNCDMKALTDDDIRQVYVDTDPDITGDILQLPLPSTSL